MLLKKCLPLNAKGQRSDRLQSEPFPPIKRAFDTKYFTVYRQIVNSNVYQKLSETRLTKVCIVYRRTCYTIEQRCLFLPICLINQTIGPRIWSLVDNRNKPVYKYLPCLGSSEGVCHNRRPSATDSVSRFMSVVCNKGYNVNNHIYSQVLHLFSSN